LVDVGILPERRTPTAAPIVGVERRGGPREEYQQERWQRPASDCKESVAHRLSVFLLVDSCFLTAVSTLRASRRGDGSLDGTASFYPTSLFVPAAGTRRCATLVPNETQSVARRPPAQGRGLRTGGQRRGRSRGDTRGARAGPRLGAAADPVPAAR